MSLENLLVFSVFLPLWGSLFPLLGFNFITLNKILKLLVSYILISFLLFFSFINLIIIKNTSIHIVLSSWISSSSFNINWEFQFDSLSLSMCLLVTLISTLVHLFSTGYMNEDPHYLRFMSYLSLFTFFMLILVTAGNLLQLFVGWEGVGLSSYLLINFWHTRIEANKSALKAMIVNRVGDFGLVLGICVTYYSFSSLNFNTLFSCVPFFLTIIA